MNKDSHTTTNVPDATDDKFRSHRVQQLVQNQKMGRDIIAHPNPPIPRNIIQYWDDGNIASDVKRCMDSWRIMDDFGFSRLIFDKNLARSFIEHHFSNVHLKAFDSCTHPAMRSDYFRLCFLAQNGGLYVDADDELREPEAITPLLDAGILQLQPLCYRLSTDSMVVPAKFAGEIGDDLVFYVANDPIITPANHPIIKAALIQATDRLVAANGTSRDIQWLAGPGNLTEALVRHSLHLDTADTQQDFHFVFNWVQVAPGDWTLDYRNDDRNWRLWIVGDITNESS